MNWGRAAALVAGGVTLICILAAVGIGTVLRDVAQAGYALPAAIGVHAVQLGLSGWAWRLAMGAGPWGVPFVLRVRWIREGVNTMLPVAQIGGPVVGARLLVQAGMAPVLAVASTILDLMLEAGAQLVVLLVAGGMLLLLWDGDRAWVSWVEGGLGATALVVAGLIAAQRLGLLRLVERAAARWPGTGAWAMDGLHATLMGRQRDWRAVAGGLLLHCVSWALGAAEVWIILRALGHEVGVGPAFVIETLAMAARSAGFAVPGAVGIQEGGFVLVCGLFGVGTEPALALSVLKRLRELTVGAGALVAWQLVREH